MQFSLSVPPEGKLKSFANTQYKNILWNSFIVQSISIILSVGLYIGGFALWPVKPQVIIKAPLIYAFSFIFCVFITLLTHEILHLAFSPNGFKSKDSIIGFNPKNLMFYAYTSSRMTWARSIVFLLGPFVVLTAIPCLLVFIVGLPSGWLGLIAILNASLSANDLIVASYIFFRIPSDAIDVQPEITGIRFLTPS